MVNIITGKDAIWFTENYDAVLVGTSIYCMLTNGFQSKMAIKYPYIDNINNNTKYGDERKLGKRMTIQGKPVISLLYIAKFPHCKRVFLDYDALEHSLETANAEFRGKQLMTTMLGCTRFDGNGDSEKVMEIINKTMTDVDLDIYDYPQIDKYKEIDFNIDKIRKMRETDADKYNELWPARFQILNELYLMPPQTKQKKPIQY